MKISTLIKTNEQQVVITRMYSEGWDSNLPAWEEELAEAFDEICTYMGDDPNKAKLVGEARWVWLRFTKSGRAHIYDQLEPPKIKSEKVTMQRVHRAKTPTMGKTRTR